MLALLSVVAETIRQTAPKLTLPAGNVARLSQRAGVGIPLPKAYPQIMSFDPRTIAFAQTDQPTLSTFERVTLRSDQPTRGDRPLPAGSSGTIVEVLGFGLGYMVEFMRPFHAVVSVRADKLEACRES